MKTNELILKPIDNKEHVNLFWECIKNEPTIDSMTFADWVGEFIYDIYVKNNHVGFISYSNWEDACCISCVYILPNYRRLGIATAAIRKLLYDVKFNRFYGFVYKYNPAIDIYPKLGFKFLNKSKSGYIISDYKNPDCLVTDDDFLEFGKEIKR